MTCPRLHRHCIGAFTERGGERERGLGNLVPDAWLAAIAIESGCEFITTDGDFARFPDLRWRHPLDQPRPR